MRKFLGVDPGVSGAWVIVNEEARVAYHHLNQKVGKVIDVPGIIRFLHEHREEIALAVLEQVGVRPGQGISSSGKFMRMYGLAEGALAALRVPYVLVTPRTWTGTMHQGVEGRDTLDAKQCSLLAAQRLFPTTDFRPSSRHKSPDQGFVDAALMAEYARRRFFSAGD